MGAFSRKGCLLNIVQLLTMGLAVVAVVAWLEYRGFDTVTTEFGPMEEVLGIVGKTPKCAERDRYRVYTLTNAEIEHVLSLTLSKKGFSYREWEPCYKDIGLNGGKADSITYKLQSTFPRKPVRPVMVSRKYDYSDPYHDIAIYVSREKNELVLSHWRTR